MEKKTFTVYMPRIAVELRKKGFKIIEVVPNERKPQYDAYVFEDTPAFQAAFTTIMKNREKG